MTMDEQWRCGVCIALGCAVPVLVFLSTSSSVEKGQACEAQHLQKHHYMRYQIVGRPFLTLPAFKLTLYCNSHISDGPFKSSGELPNMLIAYEVLVLSSVCPSLQGTCCGCLHKKRHTCRSLICSYVQALQQAAFLRNIHSVNGSRPGYHAVRRGAQAMTSDTPFSGSGRGLESPDFASVPSVSTEAPPVPPASHGCTM